MKVLALLAACLGAVAAIAWTGTAQVVGLVVACAMMLVAWLWREG